MAMVGSNQRQGKAKRCRQVVVLQQRCQEQRKCYSLISHQPRTQLWFIWGCTISRSESKTTSRLFENVALIPAYRSRFLETAFSMIFETYEQTINCFIIIVKEEREVDVQKYFLGKPSSVTASLGIGRCWATLLWKTHTEKHNYRNKNKARNLTNKNKQHAYKHHYHQTTNKFLILKTPILQPAANYYSLQNGSSSCCFTFKQYQHQVRRCVLHIG